MFEPIDEFKGDIARAVALLSRYVMKTLSMDTQALHMFDGTNDAVFYPWAIAVLLDWHTNVDPVDQRERESK